MKRLARAVSLLAIVLAAPACASGTSNPSGLGALPVPVRKHVDVYIRAARHPTADSSVTSIEVYGPGSRAALVKASSGDVVEQTPGRFYLLVLRGHFVCNCPGPPGHKPPTGTIETYVWSPTAGSADFGISGSLPPAVSRLPRLAHVTPS